VYVVRASMGSDEEEATELLTELVDAGYEGSLISSQVGGTLLIEVRVGPYATFEEAKREARNIDRVHDVDAEVVVVGPEKP